MSKINYYRVEVTDPASKGIISKVKKFDISQFNVIAENSEYIVIDDHFFTSLKKKKDDWSSCLEKPSIGLYANDSIWGTRVTYTLYSQKNKTAKSIKKEIESAIEKKYGFFMRGFDLSFITDGTQT